MSPIILKIIGVLVILSALWGLKTGKIMVGSRGLKANYYSKEAEPFLFYSFVFVYLVIGLLLLMVKRQVT